ncbi:ethylene-responsive transcription factor ERF024-like isoform X2 [Chenopodium quinoa]|nr:ethylene-responsive transcription factor ERF024-like isoform X2 [Chenopodium quinoa]
MAAVAYDVAALALKGPDTQLNFPDSSPYLPVPHSTYPRDIQAAAASAAAAAGAAADALNSERRANLSVGGQNDGGSDGNNRGKRIEEYFVDEDLIFDMPNVLANMAQGMLLSPPRLDVPTNYVDYDDEDIIGNSSGNHNLWNYP